MKVEQELTKNEVLRRELWIDVYLERIKDDQSFLYASGAADSSVYRYDVFFGDDE